MVGTGKTWIARYEDVEIKIYEFSAEKTDTGDHLLGQIVYYAYFLPDEINAWNWVRALTVMEAYKKTHERIKDKITGRCVLCGRFYLHAVCKSLAERKKNIEPYRALGEL